MAASAFGPWQSSASVSSFNDTRGRAARVVKLVDVLVEIELPVGIPPVSWQRRSRVSATRGPKIVLGVEPAQVDGRAVVQGHRLGRVLGVVDDAGLQHRQAQPLEPRTKRA